MFASKDFMKGTILRTFLALVAPVLAVVALAIWPSPADAATTFTVNRTGDAGDRSIDNSACDTSREVGRQCTLRAAIQEANDTRGPDTINFNIGGSASVKTISPASPLPTIKKTVTVDGYTQPGASANSDSPGTNAVLKIELSGANAGSSATGLTITAPNSTIRGLVINRFDQYGVFVKGVGASNTRVEGNYVGTDVTGTVTDPDGIRFNGDNLGNFWANVYIEESPNNIIGGTQPAQRNAIAGSGGDGVGIYGPGATGNQVIGNYIGTDASGTQDLMNQSGVIVSGGASNNTIGGTASGARNVVSGNLNGVFLSNSSPMTSPTTNKVEGNYIGTDATGTQDLGNVYDGVNIHGDNNTIGGTVSDARNIISGNGRDGVDIQFGASGNKVQGNYIGTDATGTQDLGNSEDGAQVETRAHNNTIGGAVGGARNIISGNGGVGVNLIRLQPGAYDYGYSGAAANKVEGNYIGTDAFGTQPLGNSTGGVRVENASDNTIGGATAEAANLIQFNLGPGVRVISGTGNSALSISIFSNEDLGTLQSELGIDLGTAIGVTPNDTDDTDTGANNLQNHPVIISATRDSTTDTTTITGTLNSNPSQTYAIQCFVAEAGRNDSNRGEGKTLLDTTTTTTDADGDSPSPPNAFTCTSDVPAVGDKVTMTATNTSGTATNTRIGDTSEFSPNFGVTGGS